MAMEYRAGYGWYVDGVFVGSKEEAEAVEAGAPLPQATYPTGVVGAGALPGVTPAGGTFEEWQGIPQCVEGEKRENTDPAFPLGEYTCKAGQWVLSSSIGEAGIPPTEGAPPIQCPVGYHVAYDNWDTAKQYPHCVADTATPPPGGAIPGEGFAGYEPTGEGAYTPGSAMWYEMRGAPQQAYRAQMGYTGREYLSPFESYMANLYDPLSMLYGLGSQMTPQYPQHAPGPYMSQWGPSYAQNPSNMYGYAKGLFGEVMGMDPERRAMYGLAEGGESPERQNLLSELIRMGLRTSIGMPGASWVSGRLPTEQRLWQEQYPAWQAGAGQPSFMDYLSQKFGLSQYF